MLLGALAPEPTEAELWTSARAQLSDLGVEVVVHPRRARTPATAAREARDIARTTGALCVVWLEADDGAVTVYLLDRDRQRLRARRVLVSGTRAAAAEEVAVVIRSAVSALLDGVEVMMPEVALPDGAPKARPAETPKVPAQDAELPPEPGDPPRLALGYRGTLYSPDAPFQSGVALSVEAKPSGRHVLVGAGYAFFPPLRVTAAGVSTEIRRRPIELSGGYEIGVGSVAVTSEVRFGPDWVERRTTATDETRRAAPRDRRLQWVLGLGLRAGLIVSAGIRVQAGLTAEFLLNRFDHVVSGSETSEPVIRQLAARPRVDAGLNFPLL
jgi:hypothetical protein